MIGPRPEILVVLSATPDISRQALTELISIHQGARITVYLRDEDLNAYLDLIEGLYVCSDKPVHGKGRFLSELRTTLYREAIVLDFGQWSYFTARCLFFLARSEKKTVRAERGAFRLSLLTPLPLLKHLAYRCRHRSGSVAGLPPGTPLPFLLAAYRKTFGLALGLSMTALQYSWRRLRQAAS